MPLLEAGNLLKQFGELLGTSAEVDIAVAWAGPGLAVDRLLERARRARIRIAVGISGNSTEPATLRRLMAAENVELRVAPLPRSGLFHPKFYRFRGTQGIVCWIGSANLTRGGFGRNAELVHEFRDKDDAGGKWFKRLWKDLDEDPEPEIARYEERYRPPKPKRYGGGDPASQATLPRLEDIETWEEFVAALRDLDEYLRQFGWDVLGGTYSYLHTIGVGREIARRRNWGNFTRRDRNILLGLEHWEKGGQWGLLGNLGQAGMVVHTFTPSEEPDDRSYVLERIQEVIASEDEGIVEAAERAVAEIRRQLDGFGPAAATRFLTLACPGRLVSVNSRSKDGLGGFAAMRQNEDHLARNYGALLEKIHAREWCHAPEPVDPVESEIWHCRAALVDAFVYEP